MEMQERKSSGKILIYTLAGFIYANRFCLFIPTSEASY
jgi:hypothetical protein